MAHIHRAARLGNYNDAANSLAGGADTDAVGISHFTPLMLAAQQGHYDIAALLLKAGANANAAHPNGRTVLHFAASKGSVEIVRLLLAHGANPDAISRIGCTPMLEAAQFNHAEVVAVLREAGADVTVRGREGLTAEEWLAQGGIGQVTRQRRAVLTADEWSSEYSRLKMQYPALFSSETGELPLARESMETHAAKLMAEGLSPEEYAAKHGRRILVCSYGCYRYRSPETETWIYRMTEVLFSPDLLEKYEETYLTDAELEKARKCRARRERRSARDASQQP